MFFPFIYSEKKMNKFDGDDWLNKQLLVGSAMQVALFPEVYRKENILRFAGVTFLEVYTLQPAMHAESLTYACINVAWEF